MMRAVPLFLCTFPASLLLSGCDHHLRGALGCISATGTQVTTSGTLSDFTAISASSGFDVKFQTGSTSSYTARVDKALESDLSVTVSGTSPSRFGPSSLNVKSQGNPCIFGGDSPTVTVTAPEFPTQITISGGAEFLNVGGSETVDVLTVTAYDGGDVTLKSVTAHKCIFHVSGAAHISETTCNTLEVDGSGVGEIHVTLIGSATGSLIGAATLDVKGDGNTSGVKLSGAANINHM